MNAFLILGCGYTGKRVAEQLIRDGASVVCTNRQAGSNGGPHSVAMDAPRPESIEALLGVMTEGMSVLHSIPPDGETEYTQQLSHALRKRHPQRLVYLSTTGVYGAAEVVDEHTAVAPDSARDGLRVAAERLVTGGPWTSLVLRPAAIYGPGRGVHTSVRRGSFHMPDAGERIVSRIHVEDLARITVAALNSEITGAYPVADEEPARSIDVVKFAAEALRMPFPEMGEPRGDARTRGRRVDGRAIVAALGLALHYPTYREGTLACLRTEGQV